MIVEQENEKNEVISPNSKQEEPKQGNKKQSEKESPLDDIPPKYYRKSQIQYCKLFFFNIALLLLTCWIYILKPFSTIIQIVFLTSIVFVNKEEYSTELSTLISIGVIIAGWLIILVLPLYSFFTIGLKIISVQNSTFLKIYTTIIVLIEIILQLPLTFLYENCLHSVFLFDQRGIEQLIAPWLIFFPCDYILSYFEIIRQFVDPLFFFIVGIYKLNELSQNVYQAYYLMLLTLMLCLCFFRIGGAIVVLFLRACIGTSLTKGRRMISVPESSEKREEPIKKED